MRTPSRRLLSLFAVVPLFAAVFSATSQAAAPTRAKPVPAARPGRASGPTTNLSNGITFDHATLNDAVRMVGEPDIAIDHKGGIYVSGPGGSTTQSSWFWKSADDGVQWHLVGCPVKSNCQNGGGDTEIAIAGNNDVFGSDLQTLTCNSTFRSYDEGKTWTPGEGCFPGTDRQWMGVYDPNNSATGRRIYLTANGQVQGCYFLVSTDNGVTYVPTQGTGVLPGGPGCIGRFVVDPANGDIFVPTDSGIFRSTDGGVSWTNVGTTGAQGNLFASMFMDSAGNLYQAWLDSPDQASNHVYVSVSVDRGASWTKFQVNTGAGSPVGASPDLHQNIFPWGVAGDPGRVAIAWYGTTDTQKDLSVPAYGGVNALWNVYTSFSTDLVTCNPTCAINSSPKFTQVQTTEHPMHRAAICLGGFPGCLLANSDRSLADFFEIDKDPQGRVFISYNENSDLSLVVPQPPQYIGKPINAVLRLRTGPSLFADQGNLLPTPTPASVAISDASLAGGTLSVSGTQGLPPGNWASDPAGDAVFPVIPAAGPNQPALDIREVSVGDDGTNLTFKLDMADLSAASQAQAAALGATSTMVMWWEGKNGLGPTGVTSGAPYSHWFVKWLGGTNFVYGKVSSIDAPALGAPTPKALTYVPMGTASGSVTGNQVTISVPLANVGPIAAGDKLDHMSAYTLIERSDVTATDQVDQAKSFSYIVGTPAAGQHTSDGYVEVSLDPGFASVTTATLSSTDASWTASIPGAPASGTVYARQILSKTLYTPLWDDVQAGPVAQFDYPASPPGGISFAHPTMAGINGDGFELDLRPDPTAPSTMYAAAPGASSANTSWIWKTTNGGKTWKWVPNAEPYNGKVQGNTPHCLGGGDTELAIDNHHHLYFNDLSGAGGVPLQFSTGRSDDGGTSFVCSSTGVPDAGVDRQWYSLIGDPTLNGGDQVDQNTLYLTNDVIGDGTQMGGPGCPVVGGNVLVMYRSPIPTLAGVPTPNPAAGRSFGPHFVISCDEGIMGNNEVSPVATTRAEDGTLSLSTAVHHVFVAHDSGALNKIFLARCMPVPFGPATANTSDPSGLRCVDKLVANLAGTTGANFPTTAVDKAGNLYVVWSETAAPNRTLLKFAFSKDEGETWSTPITLPTNAPSNVVGGQQLGGPLNTNVFGWPVAGDDGRVDVAWYATNASGATPDVANGYYSLWLTQSLNAHDAAGPTFSDPVLASEHFIHKGTMNTLIGGQNGDRALGDFLQVRIGPKGEAEISYADSNNVHHADTPHAMFAHQTTGTSLLASVGSVNLGGLRPDNSVKDPTGDALYEAAGLTSGNIPNLDITGSSITKVAAGPTATSACPSSAASGCYRVEMDIQNMGLAAPPAPDPDQDLRWLTQWLVPGTTEALGGKNLFVYAESFQGGAPQCFSGENGEFARFFALTYPGTTQITNPASCAITMGLGGKVVITVPLSTLVSVGSPIDSSLHEVRAATLTEAAQATSDPTGLFNEIDGAQTYVFNPDRADLSITKTDSPDPVVTGQTLTYTLTVSNAGPDTAKNVVVSDPLPGAVTFVSATPSQGSCNGTSALSCSLGNIPSGGVATVIVEVTAPNAAQTLSNTASVSSDTADPKQSNNSATESTTVQTPPPLADLAVSQTDSADPVTIGSNVTYTVTVANLGPATATGIALSDVPPTNGSLVSVTPSQGSCTGSATLSCDLGTLASGISATVSVKVHTDHAGTIKNVATVTSAVPDPVSSNNSDTETTTVNPDASGCTILGTSGNDNLVGTKGDDVICGLGGDDSLAGGAGNDTLLGGPGRDVLNGGPGNNTYDGGTGRDMVQFGQYRTQNPVTVDLGAGTATNGYGGHDTFVQVGGLSTVENVIGTNLADTITGDAQDNILNGLGGNDHLNGAGGNDLLYGGTGDDIIDGGSGNDSVLFDQAPVASGVTVNLATGTASNAQLGNDTIVKSAGLSTVENVAGTPFADSITGDQQANILDGLGGNDQLMGGASHDVLFGGPGDDTFDGGPGYDAAVFYDVPTASGETANLTTGVADNPQLGHDTFVMLNGFSTVENLAGTAQGDSLTGDAKPNRIDGQAGNDSLSGFDGNDALFGGVGNDAMDGGNGTDRCVDNSGTNTRTSCESTTSTSVTKFPAPLSGWTGSVSTLEAGLILGRLR